MLGLPPHTTHRLQPLDVCFFGPLKTYFNQSCDNFMINNPGKAITDKEIGRLFGDAYIKAATIGVAIKGFAACGIEPYNPGVFSDVDFAPSTVTERHLLSQSEIPIEAQELSSDTGDSDNEPLANYKRRMIRHSTASPSTSKQSFHSPSSHTNLVGSASNEKLTPLSCQPCKKGNRKNLWEIRPLPTYNRPVTNRKRQKTSVITSTPVKLALEEMEQQIKRTGTIHKKKIGQKVIFACNPHLTPHN